MLILATSVREGSELKEMTTLMGVREERQRELKTAVRMEGKGRERETVKREATNHEYRGRRELSLIHI